MANEENTDPTIAAMTLREQMAAQGKQCYVVTYRRHGDPVDQEKFLLQFWATDHVDARKQFHAAVTDRVVQVRVESQVEYEGRTGNSLTYAQTDHN